MEKCGKEANLDGGRYPEHGFVTDSSQIHHVSSHIRHHFVSRSPEGRPEVCLDALNLNSADQLRQLPGDTMVL